MWSLLSYFRTIYKMRLTRSVNNINNNITYNIRQAKSKVFEFIHNFTTTVKCPYSFKVHGELSHFAYWMYIRVVHKSKIMRDRIHDEYNIRQ